MKYSSFMILIISIYGVVTIDASELRTIDTTILRGAEFGDNFITKGKGSLTYEYSYIDSTSERKIKNDQERYQAWKDQGHSGVIRDYMKFEVYFAFSGPKMLANVDSWEFSSSGKRYHNIMQHAYNGEKMDAFRIKGSGKNGLHRAYGSIRENTIKAEFTDPRYFCIELAGKPVSRFLKGYYGDRDLESLSYLGEETLDNLLCKIFQGKIADSDTTITAWLAPDLFYRPKHVVIEYANILVEVHNKIELNEQNILFPTLILRENYYFDEITGEKILESRSTLEVHDDFELNVEIDDALFEIDFPRGLYVYDYRTGESMLVDNVHE
jgi:hypothetical protein